MTSLLAEYGAKLKPSSSNIQIQDPVASSTDFVNSIDNNMTASSESLAAPEASYKEDSAGGFEMSDSLNNMLMAWYQSGYATGYFVAQQEFLKQKRDR